MTSETQERILERMRQSLQEDAQSPAQTLDQIEELVLKLREQAAQIALEEMQKEQEKKESPEETSRSFTSKLPCPHCRRNAWYKGILPRHFITLVGEIKVHRAYYHCKKCKEGFFSSSDLDMPEKGHFSLRLQQEIALICARLPYREAVDTLERLTNIRVSDTTAQRLCQEIVALLADDFVQERTQKHLPLVSDFESPLPKPATILYGQMDGIYVPMKGEGAKERNSKERSSKEMKIGVFRSEFANGRIEKESQFVNHLGHCDDFGALWEGLGISCGSIGAKTMVVLGDGASWIWNLVDKHFPFAIQILDFYHAMVYMGHVARDVFVEDEKAKQKWLHERSLEMKQSEVEKYRSALESVRSLAGENVEKALNYFSHHASRMDYASYLSRGFHIGSGLAESSCKRLVTARLKGSGMHWSEEGAQVICSLRCFFLGGQWEDFTDFWKRKMSQGNLGNSLIPSPSL
jgi:Uncharacterised protein family (UPF0236)